MKIPVLITSSVYVSSPFMEIKDADRRIELTLDAIREWIRIDPQISIVICDGSGFNFKPYVQRYFPKSKIECLCFTNNAEMIRVRGKGYGEGENVNYAILHSEYINKVRFFSKCTSKYWVENYAECIEHFNGKFNCEKNYDGRSIYKYICCQTIFYISDLEFYKKYFSTCYMLVDDYHDYFLENAFADTIRKNKIRHITFKCKPLIFGFCGSSGEFYNSKLESFRSRFLRFLRRLID